MKPLPLIELSLERRRAEESTIKNVAMHVIPRPIVWVLTNNEQFHQALAVGPDNAKFWWVLPRNCTFL